MLLVGAVDVDVSLEAVDAFTFVHARLKPLKAKYAREYQVWATIIGPSGGRDYTSLDRPARDEHLTRYGMCAVKGRDPVTSQRRASGTRLGTHTSLSCRDKATHHDASAKTHRHPLPPNIHHGHRKILPFHGAHSTKFAAGVIYSAPVGVLPPQMKISFVTFGCRLNRAEAQDIEARFSAAGNQVVPLGGDCEPDMVVVRGCSVTAKAQNDTRLAIERIRRLFPNAEVRVSGCFPGAQSDPVPATSGTVDANPIPMSSSRAFLKVQDGCDGKCTYCAIPSFRGKARSIPFDSVIERAKDFISAGFREIIVTGCNLARYSDDGHDLSDLLAALANIQSAAAHRVRLGSLEPGAGQGAILQTIASCRNICCSIHLCVQSAADDVLKRMNRPGTIEVLESFCTDARRRLGEHLALGADVITGFPGETEDDFAATRDFLTRHNFVNVHAFPFSERPGTPAASFPDTLPRAVRRQRAKVLTADAATRRACFAHSFIGRTVEICAEGSGDHGWTGEYLTCRIANGTLPRRSLAAICVDSADGDTLIGTPAR